MYKYSLLFFVLFLAACQTNKQVSCPDFKSSETMVSKRVNKQVSKKQKAKPNKIKKARKQKTEKQKSKLKAIDLLVSNLDLQDLLDYESSLEGIVSDSVCPIVVLQDQSIIYARVGEIQNDSMQISPCDSSGHTSNSSFKLSKSQVWSIEYLPEEFDLEKSRQEMQQQAQYAPLYDDIEYSKSERLARIGLIFGLLSLIPFAWPLGIAALVISAKSLKRYRNFHPKYTIGKGMAIAGLVIGIITSLWTLFLLAAIIINLIIFGF